MRGDRERLRHILEAIGRIDRYAAGGEESFQRDELVQNWMLRHLQVIGEAARAVSGTFRDQHAEIAWSDIIGMRHVLVHDYFGIDLDIVWRVISTQLPELKQKIEAVLSELEQ